MIHVLGNKNKGGSIMESILTSIKKLLGITEDETHFDQDIIMHINSVFSILTQIGVGPVDGFVIRDSNSVWNDFIKDDTHLELIKSYVHMKVRLMFDPPYSSTILQSINSLIGELEWRISVTVDPKE
jgi:hypothetical protein